MVKTRTKRTALQTVLHDSVLASERANRHPFLSLFSAHLFVSCRIHLSPPTPCNCHFCNPEKSSNKQLCLSKGAIDLFGHVKSAGGGDPAEPTRLSLATCKFKHVFAIEEKWQFRVQRVFSVSTYARGIYVVRARTYWLCVLVWVCVWGVCAGLGWLCAWAWRCVRRRVRAHPCVRVHLISRVTSQHSYIALQLSLTLRIGARFNAAVAPELMNVVRVRARHEPTTPIGAPCRTKPATNSRAPNHSRYAWNNWLTQSTASARHQPLVPTRRQMSAVAREPPRGLRRPRHQKLLDCSRAANFEKFNTEILVTFFRDKQFWKIKRKL